MIDIKWLREDPDTFKAAAEAKRFTVDIDKILDLDRRVREAQHRIQDIRTTQNAVGKQIAQSTDDVGRASLIREMADIKSKAQDVQDILNQAETGLTAEMLRVPQPPDDGVPPGKGDEDNVEVRRVGDVPTFDFEPKDHLDLGEALDIIDIPRGVKLAGSRNYALKGAGAQLHYAVLRLALDQMVAKGYELLNVPVLVNESVMEGTGYFPVGRDEAYICERDGQALVGTAEVPLTGFHANEVLDKADLPRKYVAMSTCFRREAGAAGKDTRGLYRIHFFDKVEQVILCRNDRELSLKLHDEIVANAEDVLKALELPYRVVNVCTAELGQGQVQKYDIETWMPSRGSYSETHSASRFYEFQARRLNLRYRDADGMHYCHTLNNTVIASPRVLIPLLELNQNADGSINIPAALQPYMGGLTKIEK